MDSELTFGMNAFDEPEVLTGTKAKAKQLIRLLFLEKGIHRGAPSMGIDILSYRFMLMDADSISKLKAEILNQCQTFLPNLVVTDVEIVRTGHTTQSIGFRLDDTEGSTDIIMSLGQSASDTRFTVVQNGKTII